MNYLKIKLLSITCILSVLPSLAQDVITSKNVKVTHSNPYQVVDAYDKNYFKTEDGLVSIKIQGKKQNEFIFQKFSGKDLNEVSRKTEVLDAPEFISFYYKPLGFFRIGEKLQFIYSIYDKTGTKEQLFALEVDLNNSGFMGDKKVILTVDEKLGGSLNSQFNIDLSENKEKVIIRFNYIPESKNRAENKSKIGLAVFDTELNQIWQNDVRMSTTQNLLSVLDFTVDSEGNGYFLLKKMKEVISRKTVQDPDNYTLSILKVSEEGSGEESSFKIGDNIISNVIITENANKEIVCAGYYSKPKSSVTDGVFVSVLSSDGSLSTPNLHEFSLDFIKQYNKTSERAEKKLQEKEDKGLLGLANLSMRRIQSLSDGGTLLTGEIFYVTTTTDSKGNTRTTYHYNDVILTKISVDGEVEWMKKIPKRSTSSSFRQFVSDKYIYVTIIDNPLNAVLPTDETPKFGKSAVVAYKIDIEEANHEYLQLFSLSKIDEIPVYQFNLDRLIPISDTEFAVELYIKKKQDMMFRIEFEE